MLSKGIFEDRASSLLNRYSLLDSCSTLIYFRRSIGLKIRRPNLELIYQYTKCVTLGKILTLSVSQFFYLLKK